MKKKIILVFTAIVLALFAFIQWNGSERSNDFLDKEFVEIENLFEKRNSLNPEVSKANVAWHLDHLLKTINQISKQLIKSNPKGYKSSFSIQRTVVHTFGIIPRGAAQSPQSVRPPDIILLDSLMFQLKEAERNVKKINSLDKKANFEHPVFNQLDRDQTRRFLDIHTNHHLKIIRDITKK